MLVDPISFLGSHIYFIILLFACCHPACNLFNEKIVEIHCGNQPSWPFDFSELPTNTPPTTLVCDSCLTARILAESSLTSIRLNQSFCTATMANSAVNGSGEKKLQFADVNFLANDRQSPTTKTDIDLIPGCRYIHRR